MKKIIILNLLIFTIISFVSLNLVNSKEVRFYGSEDNVSVLSNNSIYENAINKNTTLFKYFYNLTTNLGNNETNSSCGYVALAMMLNYYDTVLNDAIVPETYEIDANYENDKFSVPSPGTVHEVDYNPIGEDVAGYTNFLRNNYINTSLHAKLALIGTDMLENNNNIKETFKDTFGSTQSSIITTVNRYFNLLDLNIQKNIKYKSLYDYDSVTSINSFVLSELQDGRPVYAGYGDHAIIIYGYTNDKFIYHNGYINDSVNAALWPTTYLEDKKINFAMSLEIDTQHYCSYHYYNTINGNAYCLCGLFIHKNHIYNYDYVYYSNNYHKAYCNCGEYKLELHNYRLNINVGKHCPCGSLNPFL